MARSSPAQCLRELTLKQVRTLGSAEWSGTGSDGTVVVRGPYGSSSAASHFAKDLHGARGGDYVVYPATHSSRLMGLANGVASCLGPGTNGYTF